MWGASQTTLGECQRDQIKTGGKKLERRETRALPAHRVYVQRRKKKEKTRPKIINVAVRGKKKMFD